MTLIPDWLRKFEAIVQQWLSMSEADRRDVLAMQAKTTYGVNPRHIPDRLYRVPERYETEVYTHANLIATAFKEATEVAKLEAAGEP